MAAPVFSIVVPTCSRPDRLGECLSAIARLQAPGPTFEVIVVDDGGPSGLESLIRTFADRLDVRLLVQRRSGPGPARNAGAAAARGQYLAFIDDDCAPASDWLARLGTRLTRQESQLLGGSTVNACTANPYADATERIARFVYDHNRTGLALEPFFRTNNLAMPTALFRELGGFTTSIPSGTAEDKEFCDRWIGRGLALTAAPEAIVYHSPDLSFRGFVRQHYLYGRGILAFRLLRRQRTTSRLVPEPVAFYIRLVGSALGDRTARNRWKLTMLLFLAQLATLAGAVGEAVQHHADRRSRAIGRAAA
jgi:glycosyltransferase involved in cell wall biosynthesis